MLFPQLCRVNITHRWGGLQSFTADGLPEIGLFDEARHIFGIAGLCGRGNCHTDVGAKYMAGKITGVESDVEKRFGWLIETLMVVERKSTE